MLNNLLRKELTTGATSSTTYYGYATIGSDESAYKWLLQKETVTLSGATTTTKIEYPSGTTSYTLSWDNRQAYTYW